MRQALIVVVLANILVFLMRCSDNDSLNDLPGEIALTSWKADTLRYSIGPLTPYQGELFPLFLAIDSIVWKNEFPSAGLSSLSLIINAQDSGKFTLNLDVETHTSSVPDLVPVGHASIDSVSGRFADTVLLTSSNSSDMILPSDSRLFVSYSGPAIETTYSVNYDTMYIDTVQIDHQPLDTITLDNPW